MDAVPTSSTPAAPADAATPKLVIEKFADAEIACLKFTGTIDETFDGKRLGQTASGRVLLIDLGGVKKISSFGIREWVDFVATANKLVGQLVLIECSPKVVDQLNMVANFTGGGRVFSLYAPFRCDYCDSDHRVLLRVDRDYQTVKTMKLAERPCPSCKEGMYFDEDGATFFSYVIGQDRFELDPDVAAFLETKLDYRVTDPSRKLRVDKVIEGRTTYVRLSGDLDKSFPRDKLAEGLEGQVIVDLAGIGRIEPAGAAAWRDFEQMATPLVEQLYLAAVPPPVLEKLCDDLGKKTQVVTLTLPYACSGCGTTTQTTIDVLEHHAVLKFATAPELRCASCKAHMTCVAGESLMAMLPGLPKPGATPELVKSIALLRERTQAPSRPSDRGRPAPIPRAAPAMQAQAPRSSLVVALLAASLVVVLAAVVWVAYRKLTAEPADGGALVDRSAPTRPAWITGDAPATATCTDAGQGLACSGVSSLVARQDDAEDEAADAVLDAVANAIAVRIDDAAWKKSVLPIYAVARDAKLAAFDRDPASTTARREVREARRVVAQALRATSGGAAPATPTGRYWEAYGGPDGKRFLAFAHVAIGATELARLVETYTARSSALGATVVGVFPLVAWAHPRVERGAIVVEIADGPLGSAGIREQFVVLAIDGRDVTDAATFAKAAGEEHAALAARGGTLRLKVQTPDPTPREFTASIGGPGEVEHGDKPSTGGKRPPHANPHANPPQGGINVWDRYGGSGRDDPSR